MRLLHTGDWHIGRQLNNNGINLLEDQKFIFHEMVKLAQKEQVDGVLIAGDLYDRGLPSVDAVQVFNQIINEFLFEAGLPVYAISGNHDSSRRLSFGQEFFRRQQFFLATDLKDAFEPIETADTQIFLLPFIDPIDARIYYKDEEPESLKDIHQAVSRIVKDMTARFNPQKAHLLVTHFAVAKSGDEAALRSQMLSETLRTVGGLTSLNSSIFADFDYVALGHIHTHHASPSENVVYSGSPLIFNKDEAKRKDRKGVYIIDISPDAVSKKFVELPVYRDFLVLEEHFDRLTAKEFYEAYPRQKARFAFDILTKSRQELEGINVRAKLEDIYGSEIIDISIHSREESSRITQSQKRQERLTASEEEIIESFYKEMTDGEAMTAYQKDAVTDILSQLKEK
ncbi:exonuclease SbcCD subunit D [Streptococcus chenjunshii]|uniref:Nuclease SbcCD subunit D n=1 Tax=Streptococcus chenjunshii TaxID=2173853 RepID=A0A372KNN8_9STRE|nr:exonuclease SbcCD subunit D [Streptococcus chenjunshii]AXQ77925.1 exonuclease SbcCD subunit D [Streptococcus chenjunshii]RFU51832.1 exonuclease SbcCD subunit D [Streptococcus chenjunshii]RFU53920.1 exonuclease SbcCD subunit D [Streptococcus chenjunshii]